MDDIKEEELTWFIDNNSNFYLSKWEGMKDSAFKLSWNWASFLAALLWLTYRKMYLYSLITILILFAIGVIEGILGVPTGIDFGITLLIWVSFGFVGNYLYYRYAKRKILKIEQEFKDEARLENELELSPI